MIAWPDALPDILVDGYGYQREDLAVRTELDVGSLRARRRFGDAPAAAQGGCVMTRAQLDYFEDWHLHVLLGGVLPFGAPVAVGRGSHIEHQCKMLGPYSVSALGGGVFKVDLDLQILKIDVLDRETLAVIDAYECDLAGYNAFLDLFEIFVNQELPDSEFGV